MLETLRRLFGGKHPNPTVASSIKSPAHRTRKKVNERRSREICEMFIHGDWQEVTVDFALRVRVADPKLSIRCPTCHKRTVLYRSKQPGKLAHFEHARGVGGCVTGIVQSQGGTSAGTEERNAARSSAHTSTSL